MSEISPDRGARALWLSVRDRILSDPRFHRWASEHPLTRAIARRRANDLFDLCAGFVYSQVLQATVRLGLLEAIRAEPLTVAALAPKLGLPELSAQRLLDAAVSLALVEARSGQRYGLGRHGASLLGNPGVSAMIAHHSLLYRDIEDPVALLRGDARSTELGEFWAYAGASATPTDAAVAAYSSLMSASVSLVADDILDAYPMAAHRCMLDVGGGEGGFLAAAAMRTPGLSLILFDLPPVARRAEHYLAARGLASRARVLAGDILEHELPTGADLITLVRFIHDHDDGTALRVLTRVRRVVPPGGVVLLAEPMAGTPDAPRMGDAYFGFYLLAMGQGRPRTVDELTRLLREAGFGRVRAVRTRRPLLTGLLVATVR